MATDPVCYMEVEEEGARYTADYGGTTYYFCTDFCRKKFLENPDKYGQREAKWVEKPTVDSL